MCITTSLTQHNKKNILLWQRVGEMQQMSFLQIKSHFKHKRKLAHESERINWAELMQIALDELINGPLARINQNQVATKAVVSHSNLRKATYKEIKDNILLAQGIREQEILDLSYQQEITKLKVELEETKGKAGNSTLMLTYSSL